MTTQSNLDDATALIGSSRNRFSSPVMIDSRDADGNYYSRERIALTSVKDSAKILEIGASYRPLAPRSGGWNSFSIDHASKEDLVRKYRGTQDVDAIEDVDFVIADGALHDAIPLDHHGTFDVIIASHVLEHFTNPISFFHSADKLLSEDGIISLIIPDKRFTFDIFKPLTTTSDWIVAYEENREVHRPKTVFDSFLLNAFDGDDLAWRRRPSQGLRFIHSFDEAYAAYKRYRDCPPDTYEDFHHTIYTPSSFALITLELNQIGLVQFLPRTIANTEGISCDIYCILSRSSERIDRASLQHERLNLMSQIIIEQSKIAVPIG